MCPYDDVLLDLHVLLVVLLDFSTASTYLRSQRARPLRLLGLNLRLLDPDVLLDLDLLVNVLDLYVPVRRPGWCVLGEPAEYDATNDDMLQPFLINEECLIPLIEAAEQPPLLNIKKVSNEKLGDNDVI